jgi:hypothetical protein
MTNKINLMNIIAFFDDISSILDYFILLAEVHKSTAVWVKNSALQADCAEKRTKIIKKNRYKTTKKPAGFTSTTAGKLYLLLARKRTRNCFFFSEIPDQIIEYPASNARTLMSAAFAGTVSRTISFQSTPC